MTTGLAITRRHYSNPQRSPLFTAILQRTEALIRASIRPKDDTSFFIWGGLAAELLLRDVGVECSRFTLHDVEMCFTRNDRLFNAPFLATSLDHQFLHDPDIALRIGGLPITDPKQGISIEQFQDTRTRLADGDLFLNNVALVRTQPNRQWEFIIPEVLAIELERGLHSVEMKDTSSLVGSQKIGRRIYRNISKALRLNIAAGLEISSKLEFETMSLATKFRNEWVDTSDNQLPSNLVPDYAAISRSACGIATRHSACVWLYSKTFSEVAMRTVGLHVSGKPTKEEFQSFALGSTEGAPITSQPLMIALAEHLNISREESLDLATNVLPYAFSNYLKYSHFSS